MSWAKLLRNRPTISNLNWTANWANKFLWYNWNSVAINLFYCAVYNFQWGLCNKESYYHGTWWDAEKVYILLDFFSLDSEICWWPMSCESVLRKTNESIRCVPSHYSAIIWRGVSLWAIISWWLEQMTPTLVLPVSVSRLPFSVTHVIMSPRSSFPSLRRGVTWNMNRLNPFPTCPEY